MSEAELRRERRSIGMIFQHFNLLMQRNVQDNVCFPMEIAGMKRKEAREKALQYLIGQSMRALRGKADPQTVTAILKELLG